MSHKVYIRFGTHILVCFASLKNEYYNKFVIPPK